MKRILTLLLICSSIIALSACKKDPAVAKVFVRTQNNQLISEAQVVIIADRVNNSSDIEYVDTLMTNSSGYAQFMLDEYFSKTGKENTTGAFDVIVKKADFIGTGRLH